MSEEFGKFYIFDSEIKIISPNAGVLYCPNVSVVYDK